MASNAGHFIIRCKCGRVVSQCRCPGPKTERTVETCAVCEAEKKAK